MPFVDCTMDRWNFCIYDFNLDAPCIYDRQTDMLCPFLGYPDPQRAEFQHPLGYVLSVKLDPDSGVPLMDSIVVGVS